MDTQAAEVAIRAVLAGDEPPAIVEVGDPVLRRPAADMPTDLDRGLLWDLTAAMRATMIAAPGVGLAGPQIGLALRIAVLEDPATVPTDVAEARDRRPLPFTVIINPRYRRVGHDEAAWYEGCLSVPGLQAVVSRFTTVELTCLDEDLAPVTERFSGWQARIVQHETDHTDGTLYLDQAVTRSIATQRHYIERWAGPDLGPAREALGF